MNKEFEPPKKETDNHPVAVLLTFLNGQKTLLNNPLPDMDLNEIADTKVLVDAIENFILEFNAAVYECKTLRAKLDLVAATQATPKIIL